MIWTNIPLRKANCAFNNFYRVKVWMGCDTTFELAAFFANRTPNNLSEAEMSLTASETSFLPSNNSFL